MKLLRKVLRYGAYGLVVILALALGAMAVFTLTERGRSNLASVVSTAISGDGNRIDITGIDGIWTGRLRAREVLISDTDGAWLALRGVEIDWSPLALLGFTFEAERVHADRIEFARLPAPSEGGGSGGFNLPVAVDVQSIDLPEILLGTPLAGAVASLSAQGSLRILADPMSGSARLAVRRTDGTEGSLDLTAAYMPQDNRIDLRIEGSEPAGGIIAGLLRLPGEPSVTIRADGTGPASDWTGNAEFAVDGQVVTRLTGRHQFTDSGSRVELGGQGAFASFLPVSIAPLVAGDTSIDFAGTIGAGGRVAIENARLASAALEASASGTIDPANESDFRLSARATERAPRLAFGSGEAEFVIEIGEGEVALAGLPGALALDARLTSPFLGLPDHTVENVEVTATSRDFDLGRMAGEVQAKVSAEAAGSANEILAAVLAGGIEGDVGITFGGDAIRFETESLRTGTASVAGRGSYGLADGALAVDIAAQARSVVLPPAALPLLGDTVALRGRVERSAQGALTVSGIEASSGVLAAAGRLSLAEGEVDAALTGTFADLSRLSAQAEGEASFGLAARGELARPSVTLEAGSDRITVAGREIRALRLDGELVADAAAPSGSFTLGGRVGEQELSGGATLAAGQGGGELRDLAFRLGANGLEGALSLDAAFRPSGTVTFNFPDIAPLAALALMDADGAARGSLRFDVADDLPRLTLDTIVDHLTAAAVQAGEVRINASVGNYLMAPVVAGAVSAGRVISGGSELRDISVALSQEAGWTRFDGRLVAQGVPVSARGRAQYAAGTATVRLDEAQASPQGVPLRLGAPTNLVYRNGTLRLDNFGVAAAGGTATASGAIGTSLDLSVRLASLPASALNTFAPGLDAGGTLSGTARVRGTASAPAVTFEANLAGGAIAQTRAAGFGAMDVRATGSYSGNRVSFQARVGDGSGLWMNASGNVDIGARRISVDVEGSVPFGFLTRRLAAQGIGLDGAAAVNVAVRGNLFSPDLSGRITTGSARFVHAPSGIAVNDIAARIDLGRGRATIDSLTGTLSTGGSISGSGRISLNASEGFPANLTVRVNDGRYTDGQLLATSFGGELRVTGPLVSSPTLAGTVSLGRTVITVPDRLPGSLETLDVQHRNAPRRVTRQDRALRSGEGSEGGGLLFDLTVSAPQQIFIVGRGVDAELGGTLRLTGPASAPQAVGSFTLNRGRLSLLGRRLEFTSGTVGFSGSLVPYLNLAATTQAEGATITVVVTGPADDPTFSFQSTPSLPEDEVLARLLFGKAMSGLSPVQIAQLAAAVGQLAGIGGSVGFLERLREQIGVDDIDVRTDDVTGDTSVAVGKYLNDRTYLRLEKGTQPGSGKATIDLDVGGGLKLRGEATDAGQTRGGIFYEREY